MYNLIHRLPWVESYLDWLLTVASLPGDRQARKFFRPWTAAWRWMLTFAINRRAGKYLLLQDGLTKKLLSTSSKIPDSSLTKFSRWLLLMQFSSLISWGWWVGGNKKISLKLISCFSFVSLWVSTNSDLSLGWESNSLKICFMGQSWGGKTCFSGSGFKGKCYKCSSYGEGRELRELRELLLPG